MQVEPASVGLHHLFVESVAAPPRVDDADGREVLAAVPGCGGGGTHGVDADGGGADARGLRLRHDQYSLSDGLMVWAVPITA